MNMIYYDLDCEEDNFGEDYYEENDDFLEAMMEEEEYDDDDDDDEYDEEEDDEWEEEDTFVEIFESPFFSLQISVPETCGVCQIPTTKNFCSSCKGIYYCSRKCQAVDWENHHAICDEIQQNFQSYNVHYSELQHYSDYSTVPINYFERNSYIGHFWGLIETRPYCRSLNALVLSYIKLNTPLARKEAIRLCMHLFRYNRSDNMGVSKCVPDLLLQLGMFQEAYDFVKWHITVSADDYYDFGDMTAPFLSCWKEDRTGPYFGMATMSYPATEHLLALVVVKYQVYEWLLTREETRQAFLLGTHTRVGRHSLVNKLAGCVPMLQHIFDYVFDDHLPNCAHTKRSIFLQDQLYAILGHILRQNKTILSALVAPQKLLTLPIPGSIALGGVSDARNALEHALPSWKLFPNLFVFVEEYLVNVAKVGLEYDLCGSTTFFPIETISSY